MVLTTEYKNQVGGRTVLKKVFGDHILKPTSLYEARSYIRMTPEIADVAPACCFVLANGKLVSKGDCEFCRDHKNRGSIMALVNTLSDGYYLIMKDVVHGMRSPRLVDLKLGTRTHSDHISEEKKRNHIRKALNTTSTTLGLRLCGASFSANQVKISKAEGREMTKQQLHKTMLDFFSVSPRQKNVIMDQLLKIKNVLEKSTSQRFFGSSLLCVLDEIADCDRAETTVRIKLIDFSSMARSEEGEDQYEGPDHGAIFGVSNLIQMLTE